MLLTKFGLLMKFRAVEHEDREKLSEAMLEGALQYLKTFASLDKDYVADGKKKAANALLSALFDAEENAPVLPRRAARALSELGLEFVRLAEAAPDPRDRADMTDFAAVCPRTRRTRPRDRRNGATRIFRPHEADRPRQARRRLSTRPTWRGRVPGRALGRACDRRETAMTDADFIEEFNALRAAVPGLAG